MCLGVPTLIGLGYQLLTCCRGVYNDKLAQVLVHLETPGQEKHWYRIAGDAKSSGIVHSYGGRDHPLF